ncbi:MAG: hypothetical protein P9X22_00285 [Candidatus Zapsychrus exili]|nr:hypothetical protein [Candidatus Zapsychrus exili]
MKAENIKALENLSKTCYISGLLPIFLGLLVIYVDIIYGEISHIIVGILIFALGYSFVKISLKISNILSLELGTEKVKEEVITQ